MNTPGDALLPRFLILDFAALCSLSVDYVYDFTPISGGYDNASKTISE